MMRIVLRHSLCPGDIAVMTVVPRELYRHYPGKFEVAVQSNHPDIWENNPYIVRHFGIKQAVPESYKVIEMGYSIEHTNRGDKHFMHAYLDRAVEQLRPYGVEALPLTEFRPCIYLSDLERAKKPNPAGILDGKPFWLIMAGGKQDVSTKWWDNSKWQAVAYQLATDKNFPLVAQVGKAVNTAVHVKLDCCANLLDMTSLRDLIWLTHCSRGVICGVTCLMHIAAALSKPAIVIAGGREAWWWDSYDERAFNRHKESIPQRYREFDDLRPAHVYLDTLGKLPCCADGGCWKRGIGEKSPDQNCVDIVKPEHRYDRTRTTLQQPRCMTMITPAMVVTAARRMEMRSDCSREMPMA